MQKIILAKIKPIWLNILLTLSTLTILIHKIDPLDSLRFLSSPKIAYLLFFASILGLVTLKLFKIIRGKELLIHTSLTQIILFIGIYSTENLHYIFNLLIGAWFIYAGLLAIKNIASYNNNLNSEEIINFKKSEEKKVIFNKISVLILLFIIATQFAFAIYNSNKALFVDEKLWTYGGERRIQTYWMNIFSHDWRNTRPSDKPGVTLAIISGIGGLKFTDPYSFINKVGKSTESHDDFLNMLFLMRFPTILFTSLSLIIFYFLISKLFSYKIGLVSVTFIGLSSLLIGVSRLVNPDALTWIFIPLCFIFYFTYQKTEENKYLYLTGILLGLGLLTKYIANLLYFFFVIEIFVQAILFNVKKENFTQFFKKKFLDFIVIVILSLITFYLLYPGVWVELDRLLIGTIWSQPFLPIWIPFITFILFFTQTILFNDRENLSSKQFFKKIFIFSISIFIFEAIILLNIHNSNITEKTVSELFLEKQFYILILLILSFLDIFILKKKIIFKLVEQLKKIRKFILILVPTIFIASIIFVMINVYTKMHFIDFEYFMASPKTTGSNGGHLSVFFSGFYGLVFGITPLILLGISASGYFNVRDFWKNKKPISFRNYFTWQLFYFVLIYFLASTLSQVVPMARYQIVIYPLAILLGSLGYYEIIKRKKVGKKIFFSFLAFIFLINVFWLWQIKPFYFSYNSFLLSKEYIINPKDIGEGNYEIAEYLNNLPNAENLNVWSDKSGICDLFIGNCYLVYQPEDFELYGPAYDYFVISRGRESKIVRLTEQRLENHSDYELRLDRLYKTDKILYEISPGNRDVNYIRIIDGKDVKVWEK